jgi:hypothetical protein
MNTLTTDEVLDTASQGSQNAVSESNVHYNNLGHPPSSDYERCELLDSSSQSLPPGIFDFQDHNNEPNPPNFDLKVENGSQLKYGKGITTPNANDCPFRISSEELFPNSLKRKLTDSQEGILKRAEKRFATECF